MGSQILVDLVLILAFSLAVATVDCNSEGDALFSWKSKLEDPNRVLSSWEPTLVNPCTWFHITCNNDNSVTRVDLGNGGVSGPLVPQLGGLTNLQYLEVYENKINGTIPWEIGKLKRLVSLDLYSNHLSGSIPPSLANLKSLLYLRLNSNKLTGKIPVQLIQLLGYGNLRVMNVSDNLLARIVPGNNSTGFSVTTIIRDSKA